METIGIWAFLYLCWGIIGGSFALIKVFPKTPTSYGYETDEQKFKTTMAWLGVLTCYVLWPLVCAFVAIRWIFNSPFPVLRGATRHAAKLTTQEVTSILETAIKVTRRAVKAIPDDKLIGAVSIPSQAPTGAMSLPEHCTCPQRTPTSKAHRYKSNGMKDFGCMVCGKLILPDEWKPVLGGYCPKCPGLITEVSRAGGWACTNGCTDGLFKLTESTAYKENGTKIFGDCNCGEGHTRLHWSPTHKRHMCEQCIYMLDTI